jgi:predicted nucleotidyltransferase
MQDNIALKKIKVISQKYLDEGVEIVGVFGSVARGDDDIYSDIDITYKLNHKLFFQRYRDGFSQVIRLQDIKDELEQLLKRKVDFISLSASSEELKKEILKDMIYV